MRLLFACRFVLSILFSFEPPSGNVVRYLILGLDEPSPMDLQAYFETSQIIGISFSKSFLGISLFYSSITTLDEKLI